DQAPDEISERMAKNLALEKAKICRQAFLGWSEFMSLPALTRANLQKKEIQKIYFTAYFHSARARFNMAVHDPEIKDRQKFIDSAARAIYNLEMAKTKVGWEIAGPMFQELLMDKDYDQLNSAYHQLKKDYR